MFDRVAIGRPLQKGNGVGVADDNAAKLCDDMRQPALQHRLAAALDVLWMQRLRLVIAEAILNVIGINIDHEGHILLGRGADDDGWGLIEHGPGFSAKDRNCNDARSPGAARHRSLSIVVR